MDMNDLKSYLDGFDGGIYLITDSNVERLVLPRLQECGVLKSAPLYVLPAGENSKSVDQLVRIWEWLSLSGASRRSLIVNLGGGMVSDIGGFAAATYKRGIRYVNIPTTLLGAVDASIGGKTAIDLGALKNQVGAFKEPEKTFYFPRLLETLPEKEILSGIGEILKYGLIESPRLYKRMLEPSGYIQKPATLGDTISECVAIKEGITRHDPFEHGKRKVLNFGHTVGHAFEALSIERDNPLPHGVAVAHGLLVELILSHTLLGFPSAELYPLAMTLRENFRIDTGKCTDNEKLIAIMRHDKKNSSADKINFTLLKSVGEPLTDQIADADEISAALDIYRDLIGY